MILYSLIEYEVTMDNQQASLPLDAKPIPNFKNYYITPDAQLFSTRSGKAVKLKTPYDKTCKYHRASVRDSSGVNKKMLLHRLVAITFLGLQDGKEVNHIDGDKLNNNLSNLEWVTRGENLKHAYSLNLISVSGEKNPRAVLTEDEVINIYQRLLSGEKNSVLAKEYSVGRTTIMSIKTKASWPELLREFADIEVKFKPEPLSEQIVHEICKRFQEGQTVMQIITDFAGDATKDQIHDIKRRKCFKKISKDYQW